MSTLSLSLPGAAPRPAFGKILLNEARLIWRLPTALIAGVALPVLLLVLFGELPSFHQRQAALGGLSPFDLYVPVLIVLALGVFALWALPGPLVSYREQGILRRLSTTPVPPSWLLAAQVVIQLCLTVITLIVLITVSTTAFGVPAPKSPAGLALSFVLSVAGLFPLGLLIASMARTSTGAGVIGRLAFFPLMFLAGLWLPRPLMPGVLQGISTYSPLGAAAETIQDSIRGQFPPTVPLLVLAGYALVLGFLAQRLFRWE